MGNVSKTKIKFSEIREFYEQKMCGYKNVNNFEIE